MAGRWVVREIKFRAWNKIYEIMIPNGGWEGIYDFKDDVFIWQQFTGLKDKNGKEIYEGDILEWQTEDGEKVSGPSVVEYWEGDACFTETPILNGFSSSHTAWYKIIGNIHENPEVLPSAKLK